MYVFSFSRTMSLELNEWITIQIGINQTKAINQTKVTIKIYKYLNVSDALEDIKRLVSVSIVS